MSWEIRVYNMQNVLQRTFVDGIDIATGVVGIEQVLTATVDSPFGNCREMQFIGRNDIVQAGATNIIQYLEDGIPVFWGPLIVYPSSYSKGAGPDSENTDALNVFVVAGGNFLVERSVVGPKVYDKNLPIDVADQILMMGQEFGHPALTWSSLHIPTCGINSNLLSSPHRNMKDVMNEFQKIVPNSHNGVDATGNVFFKVLS